MSIAGIVATLHRWQRFSISVIGGVLLSLSLLHLAVDDDTLLVDAYEILVPVWISVTLVLFGVWMNQNGYSPKQIAHVSGWATAGTLFLGMLGSWALFLMQQKNVPTDELLAFLLGDITIGAGAGALVGLYSVRRQLRFQEAERSHAALETTQDGVAILEDGNYTYVNQGHAEIYGHDNPDAFVGQSWRMCYGDDEIETIQSEVLPALETQSGWRGELTGTRRDGSAFPQELTVAEQADGSVVTIVRDISGRRRQEQQLADLHTATRELMAAETEEEVCRIAAETAESILGQSITGVWMYEDEVDALVPYAATDDSRELFDEIPTFHQGEGIIWKAWEEGELQVYNDLQEEAEKYNPESPVNSEMHLPAGDTAILTIGSELRHAFDEHDITAAQILATNMEAALARAERERSLRDQHAFMESVLDSLPGLFYVLNPDGSLERWNEHLTEVTGYTNAELAEISAVKLVPESEHATLADGIQRIREEGTSEHLEAQLVTKSGERIPYQFSGAPLYDSEENIVGIVGTGRDVTDRKLRDERLTVISRVLRHNLRNDMNTIHGYAEEARQQVADPEIRDLIERVVNRSEGLIHLAENAYRVETALERHTEKMRLELSDVVEKAVDEVVTDQNAVKIDVDVPAGVYVSAVESLRLALTEAIENAVVHNPAEPPKVQVSITCENEGNSHGEWVTITVSDNGEPIPPAERAVLTEGETPLKHGSGLGLWLINWVVATSGGTLTFDTSDEGGSALHLQLKAADQPSDIA